jgi:hypothetical protein
MRETADWSSKDIEMNMVHEEHGTPGEEASRGFLIAQGGSVL